MNLYFITHFSRSRTGILILLTAIWLIGESFGLNFKYPTQSFIATPKIGLPIDKIFRVEMVSSRKVQSFTNRSRKNRSKASQTVPKKKLSKKTPKKKKRERVVNKTEEKVEKNDLFEKFGVNLGSLGQELYEWLWPSGEDEPPIKEQTMGSLKIDLRFLQSRLLLGNESSNVGHYNKFIHSYLLHNYASEKFVDIYKRLAFYMRLSPRILVREVGAETGKFGINILEPNVDKEDKDVRSDILSLRRIKFQVYSLLGAKLLRYTLLFLLRYIRLGIPNEIKFRYLTDILKQEHLSNSSTMACNQIEYGDYKNDPLRQTYPIRNSFETMGYPYSDKLFYLDNDPANTWSPSNLVDPEVFKQLNKKNKSKLVYVAASLHPEYALQIVKNAAYVAGYKTERDLLTTFCLNNNFTSRGAKAFIDKLNEEKTADQKLRLAAKLYKKSTTMPNSLKSALDILVQVPYISGLIRRHLESGHKVIPVKRAKMILKLVRSQTELLPEDMELWDILKKLIARRVLNTPSRIYKQVAKQILSLKNYLSPNLKKEIEDRGIEVDKFYKDIDNIPEDIESIPKDKKVDLAKKIRKNIKEIWLGKNKYSFEDTGIYLVDALSATAGYKDINNVLTIVSMLSKPPETKIEKLSRQPGPEFEHSPRLEFKDFKNKVV